MPRKGENIRKRKDGRWEARYEKCRDQNGRIQYGWISKQNEHSKNKLDKNNITYQGGGIGSHFCDGIKLLKLVDEQGHIIMDYSIYDAIEA